MVDVPRLDHLWNGQKDCAEDKQVIWGKKETTRSIPHCMPLEALWQSCHDWITHRSISCVVLVTTDHITMDTHD